MKVIALIGSPRKRGNSDVLADEVLRGAREAGAEVAKAYLDDLDIRPIGEVCDDGRKRDDPRSDDDFPDLLERFLDSDIVVLATPVYWLGVSAQMKCFIDRLSSYFRRPPFAKRFDGKGYVVVCTFGQEEPGYGRWITRPMKIIVQMLRGDYLGDICASVYKKGEVKQMPEVLQAAYRLGRKAVRQMARG